MSAASMSEYQHWNLLPRAYWLPPHGHGNGCDATGWAPLADVPAALEVRLLRAFRAAGVAAYAATVPSGELRVWVDSMRYGTAEDVLRHELLDLPR
jgi:hypothetical protein